jgi:uncharacterized membrane protein YraQ (UPF0718 family)
VDLLPFLRWAARTLRPVVIAARILAALLLAYALGTVAHAIVCQWRERRDRIHTGRDPDKEIR